MRPVTEPPIEPQYAEHHRAGPAIAARAGSARRWRRTMGLLLSDTVLIDPLLDETMRLRDGLGEWAYAPDAARDVYEHELPDPTE